MEDAGGAHGRQQVAQLVAGLASCAAASPGCVTRPPVTSAAARNGAAFDRSGSTTHGAAADRARARPPSGRGRRRRPRRRRRGASRRSWRCGAATAPAGPRGATHDAVIEAGAGEEQGAHELRGRRGVDDHLAAGERARGRGRPAAGSAAPPVVDVGPQAAQRRRRPGRAGAPAPWRRRRSVVSPVGQARPPAAGSASPCRRCRRRCGPAATERRRASPVQTSGRLGRRRRRAPAGRSAISSVSRASRRAASIVLGPAASALSTSARLVIDFEPGSATVASTGPAASGAGHQRSDPLSRASARRAGSRGRSGRRGTGRRWWPRPAGTGCPCRPRPSGPPRSRRC